MTEEQKEIRKWLNRAFYVNNKIKALETVRDRNRALATKCTASYESDGSTSGSQDNSKEKIIHEICDNDLAIRKELDSLVKIRTDISKKISELQNDELETILSMRYLGYMSMQQIADQMHYDRRTIQRKYIIALDKIKDVIECHI